MDSPRLLIAGALLGPLAAAPAWALDTPLGEVKISAHVEGGITVNGDNPDTGVNFGHLMTDRKQQLLLNQAMLTAEKPLSTEAKGFDWGFKLQGFYGSDARYTHFFNEFDRDIEDRNQVDIVEANLTAHLPILTDGGVDVKIGQYATPLGAEVIAAPANYLYSHSYIFNFGLPFKHTGLLTTTHLTPQFDLYLGGDTGVNASLGDKGDNNDRLAFLGGVGVNNLLGGKVSVLALTHIGPENPSDKAPFGTAQANDELRYLNDIVVTAKLRDDLTLITDINYIRDDLAEADGFGIAQYGIYALNPSWSLVGRAEVWHDSKGFFVAAFPGNLDFVNIERGLSPSTIALGTGRRTTYGALTIGANFKPQGLPSMLEGFVVRPELRYDRTLNGVDAFGDFTSKDQFTVGVDVVVPLSF